MLFCGICAASERAADGGDRIGPESILLVANRDFPGSEELALYYAEQRGVPRENLFSLPLPVDEDIDRECFNLKIAEPLRERLAQEGKNLRCILLFRGVPLNIWDPRPLGSRISNLKREIAGIKDGTFHGEIAVLEDELRRLEEEAAALAKQAASVDSELALLGREHELPGFAPSPFVAEEGWPEGCYWVSRLDATTDADVRAMIDGAIAAEAAGLEGVAYFDTRGLEGSDAYSEADYELRRAARTAQREGFPVVVDTRPEVFGEGECPRAAVYWGWYSLAKYVDSCRFVPGAVAVHIASGECNSLREGTYWCRNLIARGAAVTMGPTNEPYLTAFPKPDAFLGMLFEGRCVGEAYFQTQVWLSWRMVLLGDPLYRPFAVRSGGAGSGDAE